MEMPNLHFWRIEKRKYQKLKNFILVAVIYIGEQIYAGLFIQSNVSNLTHILGGLVGAGLGYVMNKHKMNRY